MKRLIGVLLLWSAGSGAAVKQIELVLPGGATIQQRVEPVQPDALAMTIASIPQAGVSVVPLIEMRKKWRIVEVVVGAGIVGLPVAGFFIGRSLDRKVTLIKVGH